MPRFAPGFATKAVVHRDPTPNAGEKPQGQRTPVYPQAVNRKDRPYQDSWTIQRAVEMALMRSVWVYRSCVAIATNQAKLPIVARQGDWVDGKVVASDVADRLNFNPTRNRAFNASVFRRMTSLQVLLNRQGCMQEVTPTRSGDLYSLNLFPPNYCWPIPDPVNYVSKYMVRYPGVEEFTIPSERVVWIREPHPTDIYAGMTPLEALGLSVETDWYQRLYNRNFILNDARPGGFLVLKAGDTLDPEDWADIRSRFGNGPQAAGRFEILDGENAQWIDGATTPRDQQYVELRKSVRDEILEGFGVPESIAGNASGRTFANADAEQEVFWRETMLPHLELLARAWDQLTPEDDIFISFDWTRVPILERDIRAQREVKFKEYQAGAISLDEYREDTGRDAAKSGKVGKTDRLYVGIGLQEVGSATDKNWQDPALAMQSQFGGGGGFPPGGGDPNAGGGFPPPDPNAGGDFGAPPPQDTGPSWGADFFGTLGGKALHEPTGHDDGIMVALYSPPDVARALALPGGEPEDESHVTLCYLGKTTDAGAPDMATLARAVTAWAQVTPPLEARLNGPGRFDQGDQSCLVALVDSPGLGAARSNLVRVLAVAGIPYATDHDFMAHITRAYADPEQPIPDVPHVDPWGYAQVTLKVGDQRVDLPLQGLAAKNRPAVAATAALAPAGTNGGAEALSASYGALETKSDTELLALYESLAERFEAKDGPKRFEAKDAMADWLRHHDAWESTVAHGLEAHYEAAHRVVLEKLKGAKQAKTYAAWRRDQEDG